jgi:hypothetical protein
VLISATSPFGVLIGRTAYANAARSTRRLPGHLRGMQ